MTARSILVIDDDKDFADGLAEMLEISGHEAAAAYTPAAGVAAARDGRYDVAMIDIGLPGCDGTECARRIRARRRDIACILMTGYSPDALSRMGVRPGDTVILRKPIRLEDLHACLAD